MNNLRALLLGAVAACASLSVRPAARADSLTATRAQGLVEVSHDVTLRIGEGVAIFTVRRTFANNGARADEARLDIRLPPGAAATGLRIRARDRWYRAELLEAEEAAAKYQELTGLGVAQPKDPAILYWRWADNLGLQIFPIFPGAASTVEYTLTAPLRYEGGRYIVSYPGSEPRPDARWPLTTPVLRVEPGYGDATTEVFVDGQRVAPNAPLVLAPAAAAPWVGDDAPRDDASTITSAVEINEDGEARWAEVDVAIDHTYAGDLELALVTPSGQVIEVADPTGSDNDVRERFSVALPDGTRARGRWHLRVSDCAGLDNGTLERFELQLSRRRPGEALAAAEEPEEPAPPAGARVVAASLRTPPKRPLKFRSVTAGDLPKFIPDAPRGDEDSSLARIEVAPRAGDRIESHYGRVRVRDDLSFARLQVNAAPELSALPRRASIVFVLDASYSVASADAGLETQLATLAAYLEHVPDAKAEIVLVRREATRLTGQLSSPAELKAAIDRARAEGRLALGNGSAIARGLELAGEALKGRRGPKRVVVFSDALLRTRFTNKLALDALRGAPRGTVAHLVIPDSDWDTALVRDDKHSLAAIPRRTGGVLYKLRYQDDGDGALAKALTPAVLGLVRPVSVDNLELRGLPADAEVDAPPASLREGASYGFMTQLTSAPRAVELQGELWSKPIRRTISTRRDFERATAAFVFSEDMHDELSEEEQLRLAMFGRAVSPVTSYLAVEPGVRPSTVGLEELGNLGLVGSGGGGGFGGRGAIGRPPRRPLSALLAQAVSSCASAHAPAAGWRVNMSIETTYREIVDVQASGAGEAMRACLVEGAWGLALGSAYDKRREQHAVTLSAETATP